MLIFLYIKLLNTEAQGTVPQAEESGKQAVQERKVQWSAVEVRWSDCSLPWEPSQGQGHVSPKQGCRVGETSNSFIW